MWNYKQHLRRSPSPSRSWGTSSPDFIYLTVKNRDATKPNRYTSELTFSLSCVFVYVCICVGMQVCLAVFVSVSVCLAEFLPVPVC